MGRSKKVRVEQVSMVDLVEACGVGPSGGGPARLTRVLENAPLAVREWFASLRPTECTRCGRRISTVGGKPAVCITCTTEKGTVERPSIPMRAQTPNG